MVVLVTGATGLLGNNVCRTLVASGHRVRAVVRNRFDRALTGLRVEYCDGDIRNLPPAAFKNIDAVIHCAGYVHVGNRQRRKLWTNNVDGTAHLLARASGIPFVYVSSIDAINVAGYPDSPYALTKAAAETLAKSADWPVAIVRPGFMIGPYDWKPSSGRLLIQMANNCMPWTPRGTNLFCDARDVAKWCVHAIGQSETFHPGGTCIDYFSFAQLVAGVHGNRPPRGRLNSRILRFLGRCGDQISRFTRTETSLNSVSARCSSENRPADHLVQSNGQITRRDLTESVRDALTWFASNKFL
jgi:dihydroflavonol-4-reductase